MEVKKIMSSEFISIRKTTTIKEVIEQFIQFRHDIACVIEKEQLLGIVTKYSLYRLLLKTNNILRTIEDAIIYEPVTLNEKYGV